MPTNGKIRLHTRVTGFDPYHFCRKCSTLHRAGDLAGTQATGAGVNPLRRTVDDGLDALDIGLPSAVRTSVRVGYANTECYTLAAEITFCHLICTSFKYS